MSTRKSAERANRPPYHRARIAVGTRHGKQHQLAPAFREVLDARLITPPRLDTDRFGTFTGERPRPGAAADAARGKARLAMETTGLSLGLASEASYGPMGGLGWTGIGLTGHEEILLFCDDGLGIEVLEGAALSIFELLFSLPFWVAVLRIATPLILGTLGVLLCERAGVLNLGIEGIMVAGAFTGWLAVYSGAPLWGGVAVAALTGALLGGLHALLTVTLALSQHVSGLGITLLATALSYYCYRVSFPKVNTPPTVQPFQEMSWLGIPVLAQQTPLTLLALGLVPLIGYLLYRTPVGLAVRMVGENPQAAEGQGVSVAAVRSGAIVAGSALMGVAGAFLTLSAFNAFFFNMVNGRGWICVALVVFASWRPGKALLGALLFAFFDALQLRLQQAGDALLPYQMYLMLPYVLSIVALVLVARRASYPQALMKPYRKGER